MAERLTLDQILGASSGSEEAGRIQLDAIESASAPVTEERIPVDQIVNRYDPADPETLYYAVREDPSRDLTDEQVDAYLSYANNKDFDFGGLTTAATEAIPFILGELKAGAAEGIESFKEGRPGDAGLALGEGSLRAAYDTLILARMIEFKQTLSGYRNVAPKGSWWQSFEPEWEKVDYIDRPEEEKKRVRQGFRELQKMMADREDYLSGKETAIGDLGLALSGVRGDPATVLEADDLRNVLRAAMPAKFAEAMSYFSPAEPVNLAGKTGTLATKVMKKPVIDVADATRKATVEPMAKAASKLDEVTEESQKAPIVGAITRRVPEIKDALDAINRTTKAITRALDDTGQSNIFMRIARDARNSPRIRSAANFIGHRLFQDVPFLSPLLRLTSPIGRVAVKTTSGAAQGALGGLAISALTMDDEMMGSVAGGGSLFGGLRGFGRGAKFWTDKSAIKAEADRWMSTLPEDMQQIVRDRMKSGEVTEEGIARIAAFEAMAKTAVRGTTGDTFMDVIYWDGKNQKELFGSLQEAGVDQALDLDTATEHYQTIATNVDADKQVSATRGVQFLNMRRAGAKPVLLVNVNKMTETTAIHEMAHGLDSLDIYQPHFEKLHSVLFDTPGRDGDAAIKGLVSDDQLLLYYDQYINNLRSKPETRALADQIVAQDEQLAKNAKPESLQSETNYWRKVRMKEEVVADAFEAFFASKDPLYVQRAGLQENAAKLHRGFSGRINNMISIINGTTDRVLSKQGYRKEGSVTDLISYDSPDVEAAMNGLINEANRLEAVDGQLRKAEPKSEAGGQVFKRTQIKKGSALAKSLESSLLVKHDQAGNVMFDSSGNILFEESQKELRKKEAERGQVFLKAFMGHRNHIESKNGMTPVRYEEDGEGGYTIHGDYIPDVVMKELRNAPKYTMPPSLYKHLTMINEAAKTGEIITLDYNARLTTKEVTTKDGDKRKRTYPKAVYSSLIGSSLRDVAVFSMRVTKAGNLTFNTLDLGRIADKYQRIMADKSEGGRAERITQLWGSGQEDMTIVRENFSTDLVKYLENTLDPDPQVGLSKGLDADPQIARQKANVLSAFFGFKAKDIDFKNNAAKQNALLNLMNPEDRDRLIQTRRLDAVNSVAPSTATRHPLTSGGYQQVKLNASMTAAGRESDLRSMDVGDKKRTQVGLSIADYPQNPIEGSVALPARLGVVNRNVSGVPNSYAEVISIVDQQVRRIEALIEENPEFAVEAANFYSDMAESGLGLARYIAPMDGTGKPEVYRTAELMLRFLALGSPRTDVKANATKSARSILGARGQQAGYKIGMGLGQLGASKAAKDWQMGKHFDVLSKDAIGADDKVRNFYLNSLAELIDMAGKDESLSKAERAREQKKLRGMAARTLGLIEGGRMTPSVETQVIKFLDGLATVDMWDMASKGYAQPGYIPLKNRKQGKEYQWSVQKHRVKTTIAAPMFQKALKDSPSVVMNAQGKAVKRIPRSISELDYQYAKGLLIDGRRDWNAESWAERVAEGFDEDTEWSYYKKPDEAGLTPGGSGPVYDAQQMIDGLIADRLNQLGLASSLGKDILKARNAQEIIWAIEKRDNPLMQNRDLTRFGDRLKPAIEAIRKMAAKEDWMTNIDPLAKNALDAIQDTWDKTSEQLIPIEVVTDGTSLDAKRVQAASNKVGAVAMTQAVADGLVDGLQRIFDGLGIDARINTIKTGRGAYLSQDGGVAVSPNLVIALTGDATATRVTMEALSRAWDQEEGNIIRKPTLEEVAQNVPTGTAIEFDTRALSEEQRSAFYLDLSKLTDDDGNVIFTGYTETPGGMFIGDQYYKGDMDVQIQKNEKAIEKIMKDHNVPEYQLEAILYDTFKRSDENPITRNPGSSELARNVMNFARRQVSKAVEKVESQGAGPVDQKLDLPARSREKIGNQESLRSTSKKEDFVSEMTTPVDIAVMNGDLTYKEGDVIKKELKRLIAKIPIRKQLRRKEKVVRSKEIFDRQAFEENAPWISAKRKRARRAEIKAAKEAVKKKAKK